MRGSERGTKEELEQEAGKEVEWECCEQRKQGGRCVGGAEGEERPGAGWSLQTFSSRALWEVAMV